MKVIAQIYHNCEVLKNYSFEKYLVGVCIKSGEMSEIYSENYESFLAWYLYYKRLSDLDAEEKNSVVMLRVEAFEKFHPNGKIGFNPNVQHCSLGLDKLYYKHKPLVLSDAKSDSTSVPILISTIKQNEVNSKYQFEISI